MRIVLATRKTFLSPKKKESKYYFSSLIGQILGVLDLSSVFPDETSLRPQFKMAFSVAWKKNVVPHTHITILITTVYFCSLRGGGKNSQNKELHKHENTVRPKEFVYAKKRCKNVGRQPKRARFVQSLLQTRQTAKELIISNLDIC